MNETYKKNRLLAALNSQDLALLAPHLVEVRLNQGQIVQEQGEAVRHAYFPHSGMISVLAIMRDGRGVEARTVGKEGLLGAMASLGAWHAGGRAVVLVTGTASRMGASELGTALAQSASLKALVLTCVETAVAQAEQTAACNALHTVEQRLCRSLLLTRDRTDSSEIPLTQEVLSQILGVQRTSVTAAARVLQNSGYLKYRRGMIEIIDRDALEETSCECYRAIRRHLNRMVTQTRRRAQT